MHGGHCEGLFADAALPIERRKLAAAYGAEIVLTPGSEGMKGAIAKASELKAATPGAVILQQFENQANPAQHAATTGPEIYADTDGAVDVMPEDGAAALPAADDSAVAEG